LTRRADAARDAATPEARVRLDKWLWAARFYKTRSLASDAVEAGQVRVEGERVKPAHAVREGERVTVRKAGIAFDVEVLAISDRRGGAPDAAKLYRETAESVAAREAEAVRRRAAAAGDPHLAGRPTKRDRRKLADFLNEP
jgi:ribosome-associated heat shock protein Hsp15